MSRKVASKKVASKKVAGEVQVGLSDEHRAWLVDNVLRGVAPEVLTRTLVDAGAPRALVRRELGAVLGSPVLEVARGYRVEAERLATVHLLRAKLSREGPSRGGLERRAGVSADELLERYFAGNRPVVLTDVVTRWPAFGKWTPAWLAERFADVEVEIMGQRDSDPDPDMNFEQHRTTTTMRALVERIQSVGRSNDFYMVAHNGQPRNPALAALLDDVVVDPELMDPDGVREGSSLWVGPAGTVTPLHHDTTNILFGQVHGRKKVVLIPPTTRALLRAPRGCYAELDVTSPGFFERLGLEPEDLIETVLEPGEALFIPVGWWHAVTALEPSINFSLLCFRAQNDWDWYRPGLVGDAAFEGHPGAR
jgi:hypothetical protein